MKEKRVFLGVDDSQKIILRQVFYGSPLIIVSPVGVPSETYLYVEGPKNHLQFLFPYLVKLVKQAPTDPKDEWGTWTGVEGYNETGKITLFYHYGASLLDRMTLLEHSFRRDVVFYCGLRLANPSLLEVFCRGAGLHWRDTFVLTGLPDELEQNGLIEFP